MPKSTSTSVATETVVIMARLDTLLPMLAPTKRPISIMNQYTATSIPTVPPAMPKPEWVLAIDALVTSLFSIW